MGPPLLISYFSQSIGHYNENITSFKQTGYSTQPLEDQSPFPTTMFKILHSMNLKMAAGVACK